MLEPNDYLIQIKGLSKSYSDKVVLRELDISIPSKGIHGFLGNNGAGKSTLMKCLLEIVDFHAHEFTKTPGLEIGYLAEIPALYEDMKVRDYLEFVHSIYQSAVDELDTDHLIEMCALKEVSDKTITKLSKGYKQRVAFAGAISYRPNLIILDEPFVGLDPHMVMKMKELLSEIAKTSSVFLSSHQLNDISDICDTVTIIHHGVIVKSGDIKEIHKTLHHSVSVEAEFENATADALDRIQKDLNCKVEEKSSGTYLFTSSEQENFKSLLSHAFIKAELIVLSQREVEVKLDTLFKEATKE